MPLDLNADGAETDLRDAAVTEYDALTDTLTDPDPASAAASAHKSPIKDIEDLRRLNRSATQQGMYGGMAGGGVLTFAAHKLHMPKNGLVLTFLLSSTAISFLITRGIITQTLGAHYAALKAAREPVAPAGGAFMDDVAGGDSGAPKTGKVEQAEPLDARSRVLQELGQVRTVNMPRERTVWTKGRGLVGEVEEEEEMRDGYLRPGVPRRDV